MPVHDTPDACLTPGDLSRAKLVYAIRSDGRGGVLEARIGGDAKHFGFKKSNS